MNRKLIAARALAHDVAACNLYATIHEVTLHIRVRAVLDLPHDHRVTDEDIDRAIAVLKDRAEQETAEGEPSDSAMWARLIIPQMRKDIARQRAVAERREAQVVSMIGEDWSVFGGPDGPLTDAQAAEIIAFATDEPASV